MSQNVLDTIVKPTSHRTLWTQLHAGHWPKKGQGWTEVKVSLGDTVGREGGRSAKKTTETKHPPGEWVTASDQQRV